MKLEQLNLIKGRLATSLDKKIGPSHNLNKHLLTRRLTCYQSLKICALYAVYRDTFQKENKTRRTFHIEKMHIVYILLCSTNE